MRNLLNFKTNNFSFKVCDFCEKEKEFLYELENDSNTNKYVEDYYQYILKTNEELKHKDDMTRYTLIVYEKNNVVALVSFFDTGEELVYSVIVRPSLRGNGYDNRISNELFDYVFRNNFDIQNIIEYIEITNISSINSVKKSTGYEIYKILDPNYQQEYFKILRKNPFYCQPKKGSR